MRLYSKEPGSPQRRFVLDDGPGAFELGYRRYEWKCNALTVLRALPLSGRLTLEGIFRQGGGGQSHNRGHRVVSIIDSDMDAHQVGA